MIVIHCLLVDFGRVFKKLWERSLILASAYQPQFDGQTERVNQTLEDLLRTCVLDFGGSWEDHISLVEFSYNNSFQYTIRMAPFEALYGMPCRSPSCWLEASEKLVFGPDFIHDSIEKIDLIRHRMKEAQSRQKSYADNRRRKFEFSVGDFMFIRVSPMKGVVRFSRSGKLAPRYIGPFSITERIGSVAYCLLLSAQFSAIHDVFHVSQLRKCLRDSDSILEPGVVEEIEVSPNLTYEQHPIRIIALEIKRL